MGRIAGVTAEETRHRLLLGAASVFARQGYDGASIAEVASEAGVSSGAIYAHFASKAELFAATLHVRGPAEMERLLAVRGAGTDAAQFLRDRGAALAQRRPKDGSLLIEAIVAAKRHPEVATLLVSAFTEREDRFIELIDAGKEDGSIDQRAHPAAVARFMLMLVLGSLLVAAVDLPPVDDGDWADLIGDLVDRFSTRLPTA